jgi:methylisocitrate lyase
LLSMVEVVSDARTIANAVSIPALADADTGYGPPLTVMRTIREFEAAGLAGIHLEDQQEPKQCGHLAGKTVVPTVEMARKISAAVEARQDPNFLIVARTDARAVEGLDEAVQRSCAYVRAGADAIFPEALESPEEFRTFAQRFSQEGHKVPLIANMTEFGKTPYLSLAEFEALGYRVILFPVTALRIAMNSIEDMLSELKATGTQRDMVQRMQTRQELYELLRYDEYREHDRNLFERYGNTSQD